MEQYIQQHYLNFSQGFYGFSSGSGFWQKRIMAIGLEERGCGGQNSLQEAYNRIRTWQDMPAHPELVDLNLYLQQASLLNNQGMASSRTWDRLADLFCPLLGLSANDCYGNNFRNTVANFLILSELQPLACPNSLSWPWGNWLLGNNYARKNIWQNHIEPARSNYLAQQIIGSRNIRLCVIYGEIRDDLRALFLNMPGVMGLVVKRDEPDIGQLNNDKTVLFVPHPISWRYIRRDQRRYTARQFFTILGQSLARQINLNP